MSFDYLKALYRWTSAVCTLLYMAVFTPHYVRGIHPCCYLEQYFHFLCCIVFCCMTKLQLTYPSALGGHSGCFQQRVIINNAALNILVWTYIHDTAVQMPKVEIVGPWVCLCGWNPLIVSSVLFNARRTWFMGLCLYPGDRPVCKN